MEDKSISLSLCLSGKKNYKPEETESTVTIINIVQVQNVYINTLILPPPPMVFANHHHLVDNQSKNKLYLTKH